MHHVWEETDSERRLESGGSTHSPLRPPAGTWKGVTGEAQLADDVAWDVGLDKVALLGVALRGLQQVVELLRVEFLRQGRDWLAAGSKTASPRPSPYPYPRALTRHSSSLAGREMMISSFLTS